jgi:F0F1-type ATP synthase assembly protein I
MDNIRDYTALTDQELINRVKKIRRKELFSGVFVGFLIGIVIYGVSKNGFGIIYTLIPAVLMIITYRHAKALKENRQSIQSEIDKRVR